MNTDGFRELVDAVVSDQAALIAESVQNGLGCGAMIAGLYRGMVEGGMPEDSATAAIVAAVQTMLPNG